MDRRLVVFSVLVLLLAFAGAGIESHVVEARGRGGGLSRGGRGSGGGAPLLFGFLVVFVWLVVLPASLGGLAGLLATALSWLVLYWVYATLGANWSWLPWLLAPLMGLLSLLVIGPFLPNSQQKRRERFRAKYPRPTGLDVEANRNANLSPIVSYIDPDAKPVRQTPRWRSSNRRYVKAHWRR